MPFSPRTRVLAWLIIGVVPALAFTGTITRQYHSHEQALAAEWFERARAAHRSARPETVVWALQNALRFSPDRTEYRFALGRALSEAGRTTEARAYLLSLWELEPGNGPVNLELGRLAVIRHDRRAASRYYHGAVEGAWADDPDAHRREARLELAEFLNAQGDHRGAQAELLPLLDDPSLERNDVLRLGRLLTETGAVARARQVYAAALRRFPSDAQLLDTAARAAFQDQDYPAAVSLLSRARRAGVPAGAAASLQALAAEAIALDAFDRRATRGERARRALHAFRTARQRVNRCLGPGPLPRGDLGALAAEAAALAPRVSVSGLQRDADLLERVMGLAFRIEHAAEPSCPNADLADRALYLVERLHMDR
jgi:predicted Zn-dependent protease